MKRLNMLVVGVGGQGVVLASDIIGEAALAAGYDVKKTDTLGMAQRGGSVVSHLRIAPRVWSPLVEPGDVDVILGFEKLETARWIDFLRIGGAVLVNNQALPPLAVSLGNEKYPDDGEIVRLLKGRTDRVYLIDGIRRARALGNPRVLNIFMLGCVSVFLPLRIDIWKSSIAGHLPANLHRLNLAAFDAGRKEIKLLAGDKK